MSGLAFLWQADGKAMGSRGVCGNAREARRIAADRLRSGAADSAVVEAALTDLGMRTLAGGYFRTGRAWQARTGPGGRVWWVPVTGSQRVTAP